jgi:glyoxylase-like metal-dependent hydrolase (beta-lactamase superfamily II)
LSGQARQDVAEGVSWFRDPVVNWYLVAEGDSYTAVDAGLPPDWDELVAALRAAGHGPAALEAVVLTHAHVDHLGFAERARAQAGARVYVHEADAGNLNTVKMASSERSPMLYLGHRQTRTLMATLARTGGPRAKWVKEYATYTDGETLDAPGRPRTIHLPGHTWGSCALHLPERGVLFVGDAFVVQDPYTGAAGPRIVARAATANSAQALRSLDRLADVEADVVLTGHGEPWRGGTAEAVRRCQVAGAG